MNTIMKILLLFIFLFVLKIIFTAVKEQNKKVVPVFCTVPSAADKIRRQCLWRKKKKE